MSPSKETILSMMDTEILKIAIERATALNSLWNIFLVAATAILGTMATGKEFTRSVSLKLVFSTAFLAFAYVNLDAILSLAEQRRALLEILSRETPQEKVLFESLSPATNWQYWLFHGLQDAVVLACIWLVPWHRLTWAPSK